MDLRPQELLDGLFNAGLPHDVRVEFQATHITVSGGLLSFARVRCRIEHGASAASKLREWCTFAECLFDPPIADGEYAAHGYAELRTASAVPLLYVDFELFEQQKRPRPVHRALAESLR